MVKVIYKQKEFCRLTEIRMILSDANYELLPFLYGILKKEITLRDRATTGGYVEIYRNTPLFSTVQNSTTLITDIGAILC